MKSSIAYKNCLIRGESFQRETNGKWISQYTLTRQNSSHKGSEFPSQQYQLHTAFPTEEEADDFALQRAMEWIDKNWHHDHSSSNLGERTKESNYSRFMIDITVVNA